MLLICPKKKKFYKAVCFLALIGMLTCGPIKKCENACMNVYRLIYEHVSKKYKDTATVCY